MKTKPQIESTATFKTISKPALKFLVTSGDTADQGKTTIADNILAPRLSNPIRLEIENNESSSSRKQDVRRFTVDQFLDIKYEFNSAEDGRGLICDVGASEYKEFMAVCKRKFGGVTNYFERVLFVIKAGATKEQLALIKLRDLLSFGLDAKKLSVVFNCADFDDSNIAAAEARIRTTFAQVYETGEDFGFHVCKTPIYQDDDFYRSVFKSRKFDASSICDEQNFALKVRELTKSGLSKSNEDVQKYMLLDDLQSAALTSVRPNLDSVWEEIMAAHHTSQSR
ncbi:MAG TPA: hypothetical protein DCP03_13725 [Polaromonas sp.]|uniref:hypothetical protein n=1 Tax=Polaromonas sp. UBA4122 TaxID=1947074 RepID=UPI000EE6FB84|nr:hypothetical protein [Polaromonas sp. UBA4122]HAL39099.1 hypothetical protein [Polaromonas sp.]